MQTNRCFTPNEKEKYSIIRNEFPQKLFPFEKYVNENRIYLIRNFDLVGK